MKNLHLACCLLLSLTWPVVAQESAGPKPAIAVYKVEFTLRETGTEKTETRHFAIVLQDGGGSRINAGDRVPIVTGSFQAGVAGVAPSQQFTYYDVGTDLNCKLRERDNQVLLDVDVSRTSITPPPAGQPSAITATVRTSVSTALVPGKSAEILKWDDSQTKKTFLLEAVANRMK